MFAALILLFDFILLPIIYDAATTEEALTETVLILAFACNVLVYDVPVTLKVAVLTLVLACTAPEYAVFVTKDTEVFV